MTVVLDAGALIAAERGDRNVWERVHAQLDVGGDVLTHGGVLAQVWRGGTGRQSQLARFLQSVAIRPLDESLGRRAGVLLGRSGQTDVVDAALVCLAFDGDDILTSDPQDLRALVETAGIHVELIEV
jgi:hypothetical protein